MGTPLGDEPVRPDDCADVVNGPCISSTPDQATCIAQGMSLACVSTLSADRGANVNPRYCIYTLAGANYVSWNPPDVCTWLGSWNWTECSD